MSRVLAKETLEKVGETVILKGWVDSKRDHGKITFIDLRDRSGKVQVVGGAELKRLTPESVAEVVGRVKKRSQETINPELTTGTVEVEAETVEILSHSQPLPFPIDTSGHEIDEEIRLKYRYLDIRRPRISQSLRLKFAASQFIRNFLQERDFTEIETPILTKTTPEGARDFIVPSRLQPGNFYALPQSPQQYKQLLMVAGMERYFQFARCFRDEDPRADRAYGEFTQLDMEMSFVSQEDILQLVEEMFTQMVGQIFPEKFISEKPWPRLSHQEAMEKYGTDKPDLRKNPEDPNELAFSWTIDFPLFAEQSEEDYYHGSGEAKFAPSHHMFTAPHPDDLPLLDSDPLKVRGLQHDLVLNGFEVGGGSIRIHQSDIQAKIFDLIGFSAEQKAQFEHMLTAFSFGVPPHGGIAPGLDRLLMVALGEKSIREVIAFPTSASGRTAVMSAPSEATEEQLKELSIKVDRPEIRSVFEAIVELLNRRGVKHQVLEHKPVQTSQEAAEVRGDISLSQGAKAMVLLIKGEPRLYVLPADRKMDLKGLKNFFETGQVELAPLSRIQEITGVEPGGVPPFGSLMKLTTILDERMGENETIAFNAGRPDRSVKMRYQDFINIEQPVIYKPEL